MKKLNLYIFKQIGVGFLLVSFSLLSMLWLTQSLRFVEMVTNKGLPLRLFVELTSLLMPRLFSILSPIALFAAVMFVYNRLLADRELVVMQAAGISPWCNAKAAVFIGILLSLFSVYVLNIGIPSAEQKFRNLEWEVKNNVSHLMFREGEFTTLQNNLTVFVTKHEPDGAVSGILLNDERNPKLRVTLSAEKGRIVYTDSGPRIILVKGSRQEISRDGQQFSSLKFDRYSVDLGANGSRQIKDAGVREKSLWELLNADKDANLSPEERRKYIVEGHRRLLTPWYNLVFALLACTGLLVGNFNRRGQGKIIFLSIVAMIAVQSLDLVLTNLAGRSLYMLPLLYMNCILPFLICLYLLWFYNPFFFNRIFARKKVAGNA
jgi:lipopolysaccharide export system permease protein